MDNTSEFGSIEVVGKASEFNRDLLDARSESGQVESFGSTSAISVDCFFCLRSMSIFSAASRMTFAVSRALGIQRKVLRTAASLICALLIMRSDLEKCSIPSPR